MPGAGCDREGRAASDVTGNAAAPGTATAAPASGRSLSMHDGVEVWCDCCPCEAEPYWAEIAPELGIDLD